MKLNAIGPNQNEVSTPSATILFSYNMPVAALVDGAAYRTEKKWSITTNKHINAWLDGRTAQVKPQEFFDNLAV